MARQLIEAIRNGDQSLARNLLLSDKYGCIDCQTARRDGTALFWACAKGFLELVQLLIAKGANVNARTNYNSTPLIAAADSNRHHVVRLLIESGADLNAQTSNGDTACHQAAYRGHVEAVQLLVSHGADVDIANTKFRTPYDEAARQGHHNLLPFLDGCEKTGPNRRTSKLSRSSSSSSSSSTSFHHHHHHRQHQLKTGALDTCGLTEPCQPARRDSCDCLSHDSLSRESSYEDCGQAAVLLNVYDLDDRLRDRDELVFGADPERFFPPPPPSPTPCHHHPLPPSSPSPSYHHPPPLPVSPLLHQLLPPPPTSLSSSSLPQSSRVRVTFPASAMTSGLPFLGRSGDMSFSEADGDLALSSAAGGSGGSGGGSQLSFSSGLPFTYSDMDSNDLSLVSDTTTASSKRNIVPRLNIPA